MSAQAIQLAKVHLVSAPAGSGKTTRLVRAYLGFLSTLPVERVVAITFTRRAASELVDRVAQVLEAFAAGRPLTEDEARHADGVVLSVECARAALNGLGSAPVSTVDGFVQRLLQEHLLDASLPQAGGQQVLLDGPVELEPAVDDVYGTAARDVLEELGPDAERLLRHATVSEAVRDLAALAHQYPVERPSAAALLERWAAAIASSPRALSVLKQVDDSGLFTHAKDALPHVAAWLSDPAAPPPGALLPFLFGLNKSQDEARAERDAAWAQAFGAAPAWTEKPPKLSASWSAEGALAEADALGGSLIRLAEEARWRAYREMARRGRLGYEEMLLAAIRLCQASSALHGRFGALLVDEVQDTNPTQLEFYRALSALLPPGRTLFVGDVRQSIYRFRQADPHGWEPLLEAASQTGKVEELRTNYRSSRKLVETQRLLVKALRAAGEEGLAPLEVLEAAPDAEDGALEHAVSPSPTLLLVAKDEVEPDQAALDAFARRVTARWAHAPEETAAVLVPSWNLGRWALQFLERRGVKAQLWGERALLESRPALDLRLFLRLLLDVSDRIAVVGALKHPSIGVSDGGLLALQRAGFGRLFDPTLPLDGFGPEDLERLRRGREVLADARARLGRMPTAEVLERVAAGLHWRPLYAAGPEGLEAVAQLELLVELIRGWEVNGTDPCHALEALTPRDERQDDLPPVRLQTGKQTVAVVTVHGAKGLAWDHLALVSPGRGLRGGSGGPRTFTTGRRDEKTQLGVRLDPRGGLHPEDDPCALLIREHESREDRAERLRAFYVGFTRARRSVTLGLHEEESAGSLPAALLQAFDAQRPALADAVARVEVSVAPGSGDAKGARPPTGRVRPFAAGWAEGAAVPLAQPSALKELFPNERLQQVRARFEQTVHVGLGGGAPRFPEHPRLRAIPENVLGELVHGWLETWGFKGEPSAAKATRYLEKRWLLEGAKGEVPIVREQLASWLSATGKSLRSGLKGLDPLLDGAVLHFEWPLLGRLDEAVLVGRTDLVIEKADGGLVVIDFKAGSKIATRADEALARGEYVLQLHAYEQLLRAAGYRVDEVGLLYVRGPTWVRIPLQPAEAKELQTSTPAAPPPAPQAPEAAPASPPGKSKQLSLFD